MGAAWRSPSALRMALNVIAVTFTNHHGMAEGLNGNIHYAVRSDCGSKLDQFRSRYLRFPQCKGVLHPSPNRWEMAGWVPRSIVSKSCSLRCWRLPTEPGCGGHPQTHLVTLLSSFSPLVLWRIALEISICEIAWKNSCDLFATTNEHLTTCFGRNNLMIDRQPSAFKKSNMKLFSYALSCGSAGCRDWWLPIRFTEKNPGPRTILCPSSVGTAFQEAQKAEHENATSLKVVPVFMYFLVHLWISLFRVRHNPQCLASIRAHKYSQHSVTADLRSWSTGNNLNSQIRTANDSTNGYHIHAHWCHASDWIILYPST